MVGDDTHTEGRDAFISGRSDTENPYDGDTHPDAHMSWNNGFRAGVDEAAEEADPETDSIEETGLD